MKHSFFGKITLPKTKQEWSDFWYYKKFYVIASVAVILMIVFVAVDILSVVVPDVQITYAGTKPFSESMTDTFKTRLDSVLEDINDDKKETLIFIPLVISETIATDQDGLVATRISSEIAIGEMGLYILDADNIELFAGQGVLTPLEYLGDIINDKKVYKTIPVEQKEEKIYGISLEKSFLLKDLGIDDKDLFIALRYPNLRQQKDKDIIKQHEYLKKVLKYIVTN